MIVVIVSCGMEGLVLLSWKAKDRKQNNRAIQNYSEVSTLATISARVDDATKIDAEKIADRLGIQLSTAINVFLKRFVAEGGFPFSVVVGKENRAQFLIDEEELDAAVSKAVAASDRNDAGTVNRRFTYVNPDTKQLETH